MTTSVCGLELTPVLSHLSFCGTELLFPNFVPGFLFLFLYCTWLLTIASLLVPICDEFELDSGLAWTWHHVKELQMDQNLYQACRTD